MPVFLRAEGWEQSAMPSAVFANTVSPTNPPSSPLRRPCSLIKGDKRRRAMGRGGETTMPLHPRPLSTLKCDESRLKTHCSEGSSSSALSALVTAGGSRSCDQSDPGAGASRWRRQPCRCSGSSGFRCLVCTRAPAAVPPFAWIMQSTPSHQFVKSGSNHSGTEQAAVATACAFDPEAVASAQPGRGWRTHHAVHGGPRKMMARDMHAIVSRVQGRADVLARALRPSTQDGKHLSWLSQK